MSWANAYADLATADYRAFATRATEQTAADTAPSTAQGDCAEGEQIMKQVRFGSGSAPAVVAGMMRIDGRSDAEIRELYDAARASGIDFFDHADIYGGAMHVCEDRFGAALGLSAAERDEITLQTKCGIVRRRACSTSPMSTSCVRSRGR